MNLTEIENQVKKYNNEHRYIHSLGVRDEAVRLAKFYGADEEKAKIAGLAHDCAKGFSELQMKEFYEKYSLDVKALVTEDEKLRHARVGAYYAKLVFGIDDDEIFDAIYYHTTAKADMSLLTKIIYIADYIEPNRNFDDVEYLRNLAYKDLDGAILYALNYTVEKMIKNNKILHIDTVSARNFIIKHKNVLKEGVIK